MLQNIKVWLAVAGPPDTSLGFSMPEHLIIDVPIIKSSVTHNI